MVSKRSNWEHKDGRRSGGRRAAPWYLPALPPELATVDGVDVQTSGASCFRMLCSTMFYLWTEWFGYVQRGRQGIGMVDFCVCAPARDSGK